MIVWNTSRPNSIEVSVNEIFVGKAESGLHTWFFETKQWAPSLGMFVEGVRGWGSRKVAIETLRKAAQAVVKAGIVK